jgi:hypothetical protein
MTALNEIIELIKNPFADVKVFTNAQIIFLSLIIFLGSLTFVRVAIDANTPVENQTLILASTGAILTGLFLASYNWFNTRNRQMRT